ncbi:hypothetical protein VKT23_010596 [Stygiomarasmius scandens]|uniref:CFEM domain-containing protein n=1 Tax=Marasmiellus scandens TaxID=2682957 RepID=A0ABR1JFE1_9AGAR
MISNTKFAMLTAILAAAVIVNTQNTTGISQCIIDCVTPAATDNGCSSFADLQCVCTSSDFQSAALSCLQANCTTAQIQEADNLQTSNCANITTSTAIVSATATA